MYDATQLDTIIDKKYTQSYDLLSAQIIFFLMFAFVIFCARDLIINYYFPLEVLILSLHKRKRVKNDCK